MNLMERIQHISREKRKCKRLKNFINTLDEHFKNDIRQRFKKLIPSLENEFQPLTYKITTYMDNFSKYADDCPDEYDAFITRYGSYTKFIILNELGSDWRLDREMFVLPYSFLVDDEALERDYDVFGELKGFYYITY